MNIGEELEKNPLLTFCFSSTECDCYEENTISGNKCIQNNGHCACKDSWYGYKCLFGKLKVKTKSISSYVIFFSNHLYNQKPCPCIKKLHNRESDIQLQLVGDI